MRNPSNLYRQHNDNNNNIIVLQLISGIHFFILDSQRKIGESGIDLYNTRVFIFLFCFQLYTRVVNCNKNGAMISRKITIVLNRQVIDVHSIKFNQIIEKFPN